MYHIEFRVDADLTVFPVSWAGLSREEGGAGYYSASTRARKQVEIMHLKQ